MLGMNRLEFCQLLGTTHSRIGASLEVDWFFTGNGGNIS